MRFEHRSAKSDELNDFAICGAGELQENSWDEPGVEIKTLAVARMNI